MTRILLIGPPGSGKGTQAHRLSGQLHIPEISTGDMFRSHLANGSPLGREIKEFLDAGNLVPDNLTTAMLRERLQERDARNGFLLDGYPRTVSQMDDLDGILDATGTSLDAVVEITAHDDEIVRRLLLAPMPRGEAMTPKTSSATGWSCTGRKRSLSSNATAGAPCWSALMARRTSTPSPSARSRALKPSGRGPNRGPKTAALSSAPFTPPSTHIAVRGVRRRT